MLDDHSEQNDVRRGGGTYIPSASSGWCRLDVRVLLLVPPAAPAFAPVQQRSVLLRAELLRVNMMFGSSHIMRIDGWRSRFRPPLAAALLPAQASPWRARPGDVPDTEPSSSLVLVAISLATTVLLLMTSLADEDRRSSSLHRVPTLTIFTAPAFFPDADEKQSVFFTSSLGLCRVVNQ
jgi:hypothetical protein